MTSNALRDWCRFSRTGAAFIEPGSPWENPFVESFNSRVRDELLSVEVFSCLTEAKVMVEDFRQDYRGRDGHCWPPPAQIPACASNALGS
jgi:putative transposase